MLRFGAIQRLTDRLPAWVVGLIAIVCVVGGAVLTLRPFTSVEVLVLFAGINAVLTGLLTFVSTEKQLWPNRWLAGAAWVVLGVAILAWPGLSVEALAIVVGVGLVVHGLVELFGVLSGRVQDDRAAKLLGGLTSCIFGALALSWPDVTVLVVAVLFGARTVLFGLSQLVALVRQRRPRDEVKTPAQSVRPGLLRQGLSLAGRIVALVIALGLLGVSVLLHRDDRTISAFYNTPEEIPDTPGVLLRTERFTDGIPDNAEAWLILYSTQDSLGAPTVATAVVMAPKTPSSGPRPVVAWTHGTVGIDRRCAPSLSGDPFGDLPSIPQLLENGWVLVATDYAGMGTEGVSPYLIGTGQAYSALDSVRAARQMTDMTLSEHTVVWGHSQGGHAALWTGLLAPDYAPDLTIDGIAALSPATDLPALVEAVQGELGGALGSSFAIRAYSGTYSDVTFDDYVRAGARVQVREAAKRCLSDPGLLVTLITSLPASQSIFAVDPLTGPFGARLGENTPTGEMVAPLLVAQGTSDEVIAFSITEDWVAEQCAAGHDMEFVSYPDRTHMSVLAPDSPLTDKLASWTAARFAGEPAVSTC